MVCDVYGCKMLKFFGNVIDFFYVIEGIDLVVFNEIFVGGNFDEKECKKV